MRPTNLTENTMRGGYPPPTPRTLTIDDIRSRSWMSVPVVDLDWRETDHGRRAVERRAEKRTSAKRAAAQITTHPGEFLLQQFLKPFAVSAKAFAKMIGVPRDRDHPRLSQRYCRHGHPV